MHADATSVEPRHTAPLLYRLARIFARNGARIYFKAVEVTGRQNVPPTGPLILAANHPQSITDALILALAAGRTVHYVAHSGLFTNRLRGTFLRNACVIPIYRPTDVDKASDKNVESFRACREVLERGGTIGIFPEGTSQEERRVQHLKSGTARIGLESEAANGFSLGLAIVPVGLSFQSRRHFRSRVLVNFGSPIQVSEFREMYESAPLEAVQYLTDKLAHGIRRRVVDVEQSELDDFIRQVEEVYRDDLQRREDLPRPSGSDFARKQELSREIARAAKFFYESKPEAIFSLQEKLGPYRHKLAAVGLPDQIVRERGSSFKREALRFTLIGILGLPLAFYGLVFNYVPYRLTGIVARRLAPDTTKVHGLQIGVGAFLFAFWYAPLGYLAWRLLPLWAAALFALSLPISGLLGRWYATIMKRARDHLRYSYLRATQGLLIQKLRAERRVIIEELNEALALYLRHTGRASGEFPWENPDAR